jgi:hypothetical protein
MRRIGAGKVAEKERDLPRRRNLLEDPLDVVDETHLQHFVGLVEHQRAMPLRSSVPRLM